jgi:5-methylcytosine-specific restriction endonuclease McrA
MMNHRTRRKQRMFDAQFGLCYWCENTRGAMIMDREMVVFRQPMPSTYATYDELLPRSRGGTRSMENQVLAHAICNLERGNQIATRKVSFPSEAGINWIKEFAPDQHERYLTVATQIIICEEVADANVPQEAD